MTFEDGQLGSAGAGSPRTRPIPEHVAQRESSMSPVSRQQTYQHPLNASTPVTADSRAPKTRGRLDSSEPTTASKRLYEHPPCSGIINPTQRPCRLFESAGVLALECTLKEADRLHIGAERQPPGRTGGDEFLRRPESLRKFAFDEPRARPADELGRALSQDPVPRIEMILENLGDQVGATKLHAFNIRSDIRKALAGGYWLSCTSTTSSDGTIFWLPETARYL